MYDSLLKWLIIREILGGKNLNHINYVKSNDRLCQVLVEKSMKSFKINFFYLSPKI